MNEQGAQATMTALRRALSHRRLYGKEHRLSEMGRVEVVESANRLAGEDDQVVLTLLDDSLYLNQSVLANTSLEFNGLIRELEDYSIESITFRKPTSESDIGELIEMLIGNETASPGGTVVLNEKPWSHAELAGSETAGLRSSYTASLDVLRSVGVALSAGQGLDLDGASAAVGGLLEQTFTQPSAALLLSNVKSHHEYTFYHSVNTCILSLALGRLVGLSEKDMLLMGTGALLHDIGKIGVSTAVLQHPGRLSTEQWKEIRRHPQIGAEAILAAAGAGQEVAAAIAFEHHARFDGSGYPRLVYNDYAAGLHHGPQHFFSRLVAVTDTYDAITTRRSYRRAEPPSRALHVLLQGSGTSYDPDFVLAFIHMMGVYPPGSFLRLNSGKIAMITHPAAEPGGLPGAVVVVDEQDRLIEQPQPITLDRGSVVEPLAATSVGVEAAAVLEKVGATSLYTV
jgi:putative nucleotidyltransferase with HDIG domain